jgi:hypothetical protein
MAQGARAWAVQARLGVIFCFFFFFLFFFGERKN